ncbi:nickel/cobalt efflux protein RcnA [Vibrio sp. HDW18]|uniref:nickel/cobalt efflux protein RcnA n=1 Tax=Vibrio sp. HDW18 TaxID=2714948 RepID=UPI00140CDC43|nr:nickel/cobalt efflux protein RcnA [Vibrio sp. HDW18]QIL84661.1 nickel/cobalt efflux protein RcnA [Vibrio sp. HDW18]
MDFVELLQQGNGWFFIPSAILLGALHGLEPGHSKTMMAAFIVAVKGTVKQAVMLGLAATLSHTAVVWLIAVGGMYISRKFTPEAVEPWMQLISGVIIVLTGLWMFWRTWRHQRAWHKDQHHDHQWTNQIVDTEHGHTHDFDVHFDSDSCSGCDHKEYQDAHEQAHALDIQKHFENREVTNGQILVFGLTGGLIPCPAAITILLICLQLKAMILGATLVISFSIGLALTLVAVGVVASVGVQKATSRWRGLNDVARRAPYLSGILISAVGLYMGVYGYLSLMS